MTTVPVASSPTIKPLLLAVVVLFGLLPDAKAQDSIHVRVLPAKIATQIELAIPAANKSYIYEKYTHFKNVYWLDRTDTLRSVNDSLFVGKQVNLSLSKNFSTHSRCDSTINSIRNSSLSHRTYAALDAFAREEIGYDNRQFRDSISLRRPSIAAERATCHSDFTLLVSKWRHYQLARIEQIKQQKAQRLSWIRGNPALVNTDFVREFLNSYGACDIDQEALVHLMHHNPGQFLQVVNQLSDIEFDVVKLKLSDLPPHLNTAGAATAIRNSTVKAGRKRQLVRKLKKGSR
ncbi:hypothetical protein [Pontibacter anaerobius]|uniref:DUF4476 domain-containing protein n=1 Tax=Pontibacter anaerobius TaxID=2993940 RepID=A0ABT3REG3_9BACT|nr:hypothetical protein [Pontibacter anaerobius]MCX2739630.1 hypothetical protein [Pontibacter anaerobius]